MVENVPEFGEVACAPALVHGAGRERWLLSERVVVDAAVSGTGLQPCPGPHIPAEAEVAFEVEARLFCLLVGCVGIRRDQRGRQRAEAVLEVAGEGGGFYLRDIHQRTRFVGVGTEEQRDIVLLTCSERFVGRNGKYIRFDDRVNDASGVAGELACR